MPIGLIDSSWGGTIIEAWSPPEALAACDVTDNGIGEENNHNEYLWNGMIYPLLKMTIRYLSQFLVLEDDHCPCPRGAVWYQGEQNAGYPGEYGGWNRDIYDCTFESMINAWRDRWHETTEGSTDPYFPFGFVQLAPFTAQRDSFAWPILR